MGFRFFRRINVIPGIRLNVSKSGISTSVGGRGAWFTFGNRAPRATDGLPGTGIGYTTTNPSTASRFGRVVFWVICAVAICFAVARLLR
jgi:hypothetical protein